MPQSCPHCGMDLPLVVDAFCPECREDLSERPSHPIPPGYRAKQPRIGKKKAVLLIVGGTAGLGLGIPEAKDEIDVAVVSLYAGMAVVTGVVALYRLKDDQNST